MKGGWGDGLVKQCLQCKHRNLGLDPQHVSTKSGMGQASAARSLQVETDMSLDLTGKQVLMNLGAPG